MSLERQEIQHKMIFQSIASDMMSNAVKLLEAGKLSVPYSIVLFLMNNPSVDCEEIHRVLSDQLEISNKRLTDPSYNHNKRP